MAAKMMIRKNFNDPKGHRWRLGEVVDVIVENNFECQVRSIEGHEGAVPRQYLADYLHSPLQPAADLASLINIVQSDNGEFHLRWQPVTSQWKLMILTDHFHYDELNAHLDQLLRHAVHRMAR